MVKTGRIRLQKIERIRIKLMPVQTVYLKAKKNTSKKFQFKWLCIFLVSDKYVKKTQNHISIHISLKLHLQYTLKMVSTGTVLASLKISHQIKNQVLILI